MRPAAKKGAVVMLAFAILPLALLLVGLSLVRA
jgi:hypothetical protein